MFSSIHIVLSSFVFMFGGSDIMFSSFVFILMVATLCSVVLSLF